MTGKPHHNSKEKHENEGSGAVRDVGVIGPIENWNDEHDIESDQDSKRLWQPAGKSALFQPYKKS